MIIEAVYEGPYPEVTVPGGKKIAKQGKPVKFFCRDGFPIGGDWRITKGEKEFLAAREAMEKQRAEARAKVEAERAERAKRVAEAEQEEHERTLAALVALGERDATATRSTKKQAADDGGGQ